MQDNREALRAKAARARALARELNDREAAERLNELADELEELASKDTQTEDNP